MNKKIGLVGGIVFGFYVGNEILDETNIISEINSEVQKVEYSRTLEKTLIDYFTSTKPKKPLGLISRHEMEKIPLLKIILDMKKTETSYNGLKGFSCYTKSYSVNDEVFLLDYCENPVENLDYIFVGANPYKAHFIYFNINSQKGLLLDLKNQKYNADFASNITSKIADKISKKKK